MQCVHTAPWACCPPRNSLNSVRGMQAADGPNSSQLEWHQIRVKTKSDDYCVNCGLKSGGRSRNEGGRCNVIGLRTDTLACLQRR